MPLTPMQPLAARRQTGRGNRFPYEGWNVQKLFSRLCSLLTGIVIVSLLLLPAFCPSPLLAREDNARLLFQKTAGDSKTRVHVVKKGESIASILHGKAGKEPVSRALIRRLNPNIPDLNRIFPGQRIILPIPGLWEAVESTATKQKERTPPLRYQVREDDSISRIILSELNVNPAEALPTYRLIRKLNPEIPDLIQIKAGQTLRLPSALTLPAPVTNPPQTVSSSTDKPPVEDAVRTPTATDTRHGIIRPVINRMRGTVTDSGNYFIPLQETTQVTIDCSMIPVVELDDGTTVLLDYGNRLAPNLKDLIRQSWKNYEFVPTLELLDDLGALQSILRRSRNYSMTKADKPISLSGKAEVLAFPDWIITGIQKKDGITYRQALFLLDRGERPLPAEARVLLEKSGVVVTEIAEKAVIASAPEIPQTSLRAAMTDLRGSQGIALAQQLLTVIGETAIRNAEVVIFDQIRNGFNLSITADLLVRKEEKKFILHTKKLPEQFLQVLREAGTGVIPIGEKDQGRPLIEGVLQGLGIPVSFGYFTFRIPEEGKRPRFTASFSALKAIIGGNPVYLVDFDLPPSVPAFLIGRKTGSIVRY
jgi:hypothetical protein